MIDTECNENVVINEPHFHVNGSIRMKIVCARRDIEISNLRRAVLKSDDFSFFVECFCFCFLVRKQRNRKATKTMAQLLECTKGSVIMHLWEREEKFSSEKASRGALLRQNNNRGDFNERSQR